MSIAAAATNNATWCAAVAEAHGRGGEWRDDAWTCATRTPPLHPDAVTLQAELDVPALLDRIDRAAGCSIKDSFASLDLRPQGFHALFDAHWIRRPMPEGAHVPASWERIADADGLERWTDAWMHGGADDPGPFGVGLLQRPEIAFVGRRARRDGDISAGAVLNLAASVVGVSNVFTTSGPIEATWAAVPRLAAAVFPEATGLCGYETGPDLALAAGAGFSPIGALRVWINA